MKKLGLDIEPHRKRIKESQPGLDEKFKTETMRWSLLRYVAYRL